MMWKAMFTLLWVPVLFMASEVYPYAQWSGDRPVGRYERLCYERHERDLTNAGERGLWFDEYEARRRCDAFPTFLKHFEGEWAGRPFDLMPWERFVISNLYGWKRLPEGMTIKQAERIAGKLEESDREKALMDEGILRRFSRGLIEVPKKSGKALAVDTPIATPTGWATMGELQPGDQVFGEDGNPCNVLASTPQMENRECYKVVFSDGAEIVADAEHLWMVRSYRTGRIGGAALKGHRLSEFRNAPKDMLRTTKQIKETLDVDCPAVHRQGGVMRNHRVICAKALQLPDAEFLIPPYVLGAWLGDGNSADSRLTCSYEDSGVLDEIRREGISVDERGKHTQTTGRFILGSSGRGKPDSLQSKLRSLDLLNNKHIPLAYFRGSEKQRRDLLQGLMDTDGYISAKGHCEFTTTSPRIASDVADLLLTLGYKPQFGESDAKLNGITVSKKWRIRFHSTDDKSAFRLKRKADRQKPYRETLTRSNVRQIVAVVPVESVPVKCIQVDSPSGLFLAGRALIPTHNSPLMGGIALLSLVMDNEPGSQVRSVATKRDQAKIVFDASRKMLSFSTQLKPFVKSFQTALVVDQTNSNFKPLSAEAGGEDGMNPHLAIIDELHRHANPDLVQLLMMSFGARRQPLLLAITTAGGEGKSVWREWHEDGEKILEQVESSDKFFVFMAGADADDDWTLTETHRKANPSYGITIKPESIREECDAAIRMPRLRPDFMRFRLNLPINLAERWIDMDAWNAGLAEFDETTLFGRPCYIGLDLSRTTDLTARAALFPPLNGDPNWYVLSKAWIPADKIEQRSKRDRVPFSEWYRAGQVIATPGNVVDYAFIQADVESLSKQFDVLEIAYDPWNATKFATDLQNAGHDNLVEVRQGTRSLSPAMKEIERLVLQGRFKHNGDPVLSWCMANVVARADANENIAPDKTTSKERIDAAVALITAMSRAAVQEDALNPYDERGLLSV